MDDRSCPECGASMRADWDWEPGMCCDDCFRKQWAEAVEELIETDPDFVAKLDRLFGPESGYIGHINAITGVFHPPSGPEIN